MYIPWTQILRNYFSVASLNITVRLQFLTVAHIILPVIIKVHPEIPPEIAPEIASSANASHNNLVPKIVERKEVDIRFEFFGS